MVIKLLGVGLLARDISSLFRTSHNSLPEVYTLILSTGPMMLKNLIDRYGFLQSKSVTGVIQLAPDPQSISPQMQACVLIRITLPERSLPIVRLNHSVWSQEITFNSIS